MAGYGVSLVEITAPPGKLDELFKQFTEHPMGLAYTASQPGFLNLDVGIDREKNSVVFFEKWVKKEDWVTYAKTRGVKNDGNATWTAISTPLTAGARAAPLDCLKNYKGTATKGASWGIALVEVPAKEGKLDDLYKAFTEHPMGLEYTSKQPGFLNLDVALDKKANSIIFFETWVKKEDWVAYSASRRVDNEGNKAWGQIMGPLVAGPPRAAPMDCAKNFPGPAAKM